MLNYDRFMCAVLLLSAPMLQLWNELAASLQERIRWMRNAHRFSESGAERKKIARNWANSEESKLQNVRYSGAGGVWGGGEEKNEINTWMHDSIWLHFQPISHVDNPISLLCSHHQAASAPFPQSADESYRMELVLPALNFIPFHQFGAGSQPTNQV